MAPLDPNLKTRRPKTFYKPFARISILVLVAAAAAAAQPGAQVRRANAQLAVEPSRQLLDQRAAALRELIRSDPGEALALALEPAAAERLRASFPGSTAEIETWGQWSGEAEVLVIDDFEHRASRKHVIVHLPDGTLSVFTAAGTPKLKCGDIVKVSGIRLGGEAAARTVGVRATTTAATCSTTGTQRVAVLLVNFPGAPLPAGVTPAAVQSYFFGNSGHSLATMWNEFSYGAATASGNVFGPFTLAQDYTCDQTDSIRTAAIQAADGVVTWANYSRIYIIVPNAGSCAIGVGTIGCGTMNSPSQGSFQASTSWIRADLAAQGGDTVVEDIVHEGGHNLGLEHAGSLTFSGQPLGAPGVGGVVDEYGDYYATMGVEYSYNNSVLFGHYDAPHKSALGWLAPGNVQTVQTTGSFVLNPYEPATGGLKALRVRRGSSTDKWLWLEYRTPAGSDASFAVLTSQLYSGATVHYDDPEDFSAAGYTRLLNFGAPASTDWLAPALSGTWSDPYTDLTISVSAPNGSGLPVSVSYGQPCAALSPGSASFGAGAANGSVSVSAPAGCAWYAASNASWIALTGAVSGTGPGTVGYSVTANTSTSARTGTITIGGVNFQVTQAGANPPTPVSVSPQMGAAPTGTNRTFQFTFSDGSGASALATVDVLFNSSLTLAGGCAIEYARATGTLSLANDSATAWTPAPIGSSTPPASNSQCTLSFAGSSASAAGNTLILNVTASFSGAFAGGKNVYGSAQDGLGANSGYQLLGTWTIRNTAAPLPASDFDRNGTSDLVWQNDGTGQVTVNYYGGSGGATYQGWAWLYPASESGWHVAAVADFNGDGVPDLVWQNDSTRQVTLHYYGGAGGSIDTAWNWLYPTLGAAGWHVVAAADFNGDGVPDLVWQNDTTRQVTVHYYGGPGGAADTGWNWLYPGLGAAGWHVFAAADFNGDGIADLVWQNDATRQVTVHYYGGPGGATDVGWNWLYPGMDAGAWHVAGVGDLNGDGVPDLIWQNDATRQVTVHYYGGPGGATDAGWNWLYPGMGAAGWSVVN